MAKQMVESKLMKKLPAVMRLLVKLVKYWLWRIFKPKEILSRYEHSLLHHGRRWLQVGLHSVPALPENANTPKYENIKNIEPSHYQHVFIDKG